MTIRMYGVILTSGVGKKYENKKEEVVAGGGNGFFVSKNGFLFRRKPLTNSKFLI